MKVQRGYAPVTVQLDQSETKLFVKALNLHHKYIAQNNLRQFRSIAVWTEQQLEQGRMIERDDDGLWKPSGDSDHSVFASVEPAFTLNFKLVDQFKSWMQDLDVLVQTLNPDNRTDTSRTVNCPVYTLIKNLVSACKSKRGEHE